ncbi:hypothetical protein G5C66_04105 [Nocardioides sp. KC13]|uniref:Uncharacterized protein n=1 Tax=Nocardioides turkmenicus TaxID=2711220 RepID=A0A6M1R2H4_9ACTN|nr:hypothetical protein [Nocardioides sp. KC13]NGN91918.1 hypothetical protein [Nocardioides sp. KC13]
MSLAFILVAVACGQESAQTEGDSMCGIFSDGVLEGIFGEDVLRVEKSDSSSNSASCVIYDDTLGHSVVTVNAGARSDGDDAKMAQRVADLTKAGSEVEVAGLEELDAARVTRDDSGVREKYYVGAATDDYLIHLIYTPGHTDPTKDAKAIVALIEDADSNLGDVIEGADTSTTSTEALSERAEGAPRPDRGDAPSWLSTRLG